MKWLSVPAIKWKLPVITVATVVAVILSLSPAAFSSPEKQPLRDYGQIGLYDLMSQRKEIYDARLQSVDHTLQSTITSPNDNRLVLKGKIEKLGSRDQKRFYSYTPIYQNLPQQGLMINGLTDLFTYTGISMEPIELNGELIALGQNGMIILYKAP